MALALSSCQGLKLLSSHALWLTEGNIIINTNSNASQMAVVLFGCCFRYMALALSSPQGLKHLSSRARGLAEDNIILNTNSNAFQTAIAFLLLLLSLQGPRAPELSMSDALKLPRPQGHREPF